jgi:hypothetical protein
MAEVFDRKLLFDNIAALVKRSGLKIGELETKAGVSAGYMARTIKDGTAKPGIEFVMGVAEQLHVSTDLLLNADLTKMDANAIYLIGFVEKLIKDTVENKLFWERETEEDLSHLEWDGEGDVNHPLFITEFNKDGDGRVLFNSRAYSYKTRIAGDCFNLGLQNKARLYIMNISTYDSEVSAAKEIWIDIKPAGATYLCSTMSGPAFATAIENLYSYVAEELRHPNLRPDLKVVIDAFMNDSPPEAIRPVHDKVEVPF